MAEYMDIARIDDWDNLSIIDDDGYAINVYDVGELPRADVVERAKIDKAIEKIENYTPCIEAENMRYAFECGMGKALEIIKRNIGESK